MAEKRWVLAIVDGLRGQGLERARLLYALYALVCVLLVGMHFFGVLHWQLFFAAARSGEAGISELWSAPLDDVFIHFDFARSTARGYPLQWSIGNGYSSGGTSLLYPFLLAAGYVIGYDGASLMLWAGVLACVSTWLLLLGARRLFDTLPAASAALLPPFLLSVGALNWSLFSGMEVAVFLATWAACVVCWLDWLKRPTLRHAWWLGAAGALMVSCRPEAAPLVAMFGISGALWSWRQRSAQSRLVMLIVTGAPGALVIIGHAVANKLFTGDSSAAGALVKLELNHPFMTSRDIFDAWKFHVEYQVLRVTDYHFSELRVPLGNLELSVGWVVWVLALLPLLFSQTRRAGIMLWCCMVLWVAVTALNGQVRWQNERYTMPAVAWLLIAAALGLAALATQGLQSFIMYRNAQASGTGTANLRAARSRLWVWGSAGTAALIAAVVFAHFQEPRYRGQAWFFGRAARNIYEQHIAAARHLRSMNVNRVLLGDAGAIPYVSDLPALDIIGLGGFHSYPFARATRTSVAAAIELIQRMPRSDRPEVMAIYPSWWGDLPSWFGTRVSAFPVRGNVICGGPSKVLYRADWTPLDTALLPFTLDQQQLVLAELDVADLMSERANRFELLGAPGFVTMKLLPHPQNQQLDAWDAGRILPAGSRMRFVLHELAPNEATTLVLRFAPSTAAELKLTSGGATSNLTLAPTDGWLELKTQLPLDSAGEDVSVQLEVVSGEAVLYHVWGLQNR